MSVIQKIRDKYARIAVIAIGLALLGFILMDAFAGRGSFFGDRDNTLGKINGKEVKADEFGRRVLEIEKQPNSQYSTQQIVDGLWQQELAKNIMGEQYEELGLTITDRELDQLLYGTNPSAVVRQIFGNPQTWDGNMVRQRLGELKRGTLEQKAQVEQLINDVKTAALMDKYNSLLTNSVYAPKWFLDKRNIDNSQMAKASYVTVPYTTIADSTVKVTDEEISSYVKAHEKAYELKEESRSISYVLFSAAPSSADTAAVRNTMLALRDSFTATTSAKDFLMTNRSKYQFGDVWMAQKDVQLQNADTIFKASQNVAIGPFVEPALNALIMTKIVEKSTQPDTVKVRHILIGTMTQDPQTGQQIPLRDSVSAKRIADSVNNALNTGSNFDSLVVKLSDDQGSKLKGGVYDSITRQTNFVPEFKNFAFSKPVGTREIVKTDFGYHIIEVLSQKGSSAVVKLAVFGLPIDVSPETESEASNNASQLVGNAKDEKTFNDYFEKSLKIKGYNKLSAQGIKAMDYSINGVNGQPNEVRQVIKAIYDADKGDVIDTKKIGSDYIVTIVTDVSEPGLPSATAARPLVEPLLINKKKADKIKQQMGTITDLSAVAAKFQQKIESADSIRFSGGPVLGYETKVLGALFNPNIKGKVSPEGIAGNTGVFAIKVDNTFTGAVENADINLQRKMMEQQGRQVGSPLDLLKKRAEIKDYRAKFY
jgi:peptidyl-prolyl cis-trans isomerase D